ncbi:MBL fold metallo-hydrolase [Coraliomargarita sp. W4R53]
MNSKQIPSFFSLLSLFCMFSTGLMSSAHAEGLSALKDLKEANVHEPVDRDFPTVYSNSFDGRNAAEIYAEWRGIYRASREYPVNQDGWLMADWNTDSGLGYAFRTAYRNARYAFELKTSGSDRADRDAHAVVVLRTEDGGNRYGSIAAGRNSRGAGIGLHVFNAEQTGKISLTLADARGEILSKATVFHLPTPSEIDFTEPTRLVIYDLDDRLFILAGTEALATIYLSDLDSEDYYNSGVVYDCYDRLVGSFHDTRIARDSALAFTFRNSDLYIDNFEIGRRKSPAIGHAPVFTSALDDTPYERVEAKLPIRIEVMFEDGGKGLYDVQWQDLSTAYSQSEPGTHFVGGTLSSSFQLPVQLKAKARVEVLEPLPSMPGGQTVIYQLQPEPNNLHLGYVIRTPNDRFIVVDGGGQTQDSVPTFHLLSTLQEITQQEHPVIDAWFFTHPHYDHIGEFTRIGLEAYDSITVQNIYCNFPPQNWIEKREGSYFVERNPGFLDRFAKAFNHLMGKDAWDNYEKIQQGDMIVVDNVTFDILQVADGREQHYHHSPVNNASIVFRMTAEGQTMLFLGDLAVEGGEILAQTYGGHLESDMVQMAHHGQGGVDREIYRLISPELCFWPTPLWLWKTEHPNFQTQITRSWMRELGIDNHLVAGQQGLYAVPLPFKAEDHSEALGKARE